MSRLKVHVVPILSDNYGYILEDTQTHEAVVIDPGDEKPLTEFMKKHGLKPVAVWNTHHHSDHVAGNAAVLARWGEMPVVGPAADKERIPELTEFLKEGDELSFAGETARILAVPGHTCGHIAIYFPCGHIFLGDLIFGYSCGNVMDGMMEQMHSSVSKLLDLPDETSAYCGHEYTLNNRKWASTVEPDNQDVKDRIARETTPPTIPLNLGVEKRTNPFLRCHVPAVQAFVGKSEPAEVFAELRTRKNNFR